MVFYIEFSRKDTLGWYFTCMALIDDCVCVYHEIPFNLFQIWDILNKKETFSRTEAVIL
jgi:hypothetical protein